MPFADPTEVEAHPIDGGLFVMHTHNAASDFTEYTLDNGATWLTPNHEQTYLDEHPIIYYRLGETSGTTAIDSSGNNRHGTYSGAYSLGQPPAIASTLPDPDKSFYTPNLGGVILPSAQFPLLHTNQLTVSAWIYPESITGVRHIMSKMNAEMTDNATNWAWGFRTNAAKLELVVRNTSTQTSTTTANYIVLNTWQHVAVVYNGSNIYFYYNGALVDTKSGSQLISSTCTADFKVGLNSQTTTNFMGGIDEAAVFDYPMSAQKVRKLYLAGKARFANTASIRGLTNGTTYKVGVRLSQGAEKSLSTIYREVVPTSEAPLLVLDRFNRENNPNHPGHPDWGTSLYTNLYTNNAVGINNNYLYSRSTVTSGDGLVLSLPMPTRNIDISYEVAVPPTGASENVGFYLQYVASNENLLLSHKSNSILPSFGLYYSDASQYLFSTNEPTIAGDVFRLYSHESKVFISKNGKIISIIEDPKFLDRGLDPAYDSKNFLLCIKFQGSTVARFDNLVVYQTKPNQDTDWINNKKAFLYKGRATRTLDRPRYQP
ncbi:MAG: LamG domain-containing protein [Spirochaetes bacterium]|nr:MAG: LamG domain-containing protein [Spirochaetota bacterium]